MRWSPSFRRVLLCACTIEIMLIALCAVIYSRWDRESRHFARNRTKTPAQAVEHIERLGGEFNILVRKDNPRTKGDVSGEKVWVDLAKSRATDADLKELAPLNGITDLYLSDTNISDSGLEILGAFEHLESLDLSGTNVTDAGIKYLLANKALKYLFLDRTNVTGEGFKDLAALQQLSVLRLRASGEHYFRMLG